MVSMDSLPIEVLLFDLGLGRYIISQRGYYNSTKKDYDEYYEHFQELVSSFATICDLAENAIIKINTPRWYIESFFMNDHVDRHFVDTYGEKAMLFYKLGKDIWEIAIGPHKRGIYEKIFNMCEELSLNGLINEVISPWFLNGLGKLSDNKERLEFIKKVRLEILKNITELKNDVFISHSHKDHELVKELVFEFERKNINCFLAPRDIVSGNPWHDDIRKSLHSCNELLVVLTPHSISSDWVMIEAGAAWSLNKKINIAYAFVDIKQLPEIFTEVQMVNIETIDGRKRLVKEISSRIVLR